MIKIAHARSNEIGQISGGKAGDQTGKEVCIQDYYDGKWEYVLRPKNKELAEKVAKYAEQIAQNDNIGYDQPDRYSMYTQAKAKKFDFTAIDKTCNTDCSQMVATILIACGLKVSPYIYTGNMVNAIVGTGLFEQLSLGGSNSLRKGDILVTVTNRHTVVVIANTVIDDYVSSTPMYVGEVYGSATVPVRTKRTNKSDKLAAWPDLGVGNLVDVCDIIFDNGTYWCYVRIAGKYYGWVERGYILLKSGTRTGTASTDVYLRSNPGAEYKALTVIKKGTKVVVCDEKPTKTGTPWYYVLVNGMYGFCTTKYIKNVVTK